MERFTWKNLFIARVRTNNNLNPHVTCQHHVDFSHAQIFFKKCQNGIGFCPSQFRLVRVTNKLLSCHNLTFSKIDRLNLLLTVCLKSFT